VLVEVVLVDVVLVVDVEVVDVEVVVVVGPTKVQSKDTITPTPAREQFIS
jgi:hypothetical protein